MAIGSGFFVFAVLAAAVSFLANRHFVEAAGTQPVEFNHRLHVEDEELECSVCHIYFEQGVGSGLPTADMCALCHLEPLGESAEEARLSSLLEEGASLDWASVFRQPPHVFFSHRRHVTVAGLECTTCHGDVGSSERAPRGVQPLEMDTCTDCHEREGVSNACTRCHR